jgi:EAL domain-containing protein (putative c-di-GMP-specific phosphodiesterase class I)
VSDATKGMAQGSGFRRPASGQDGRQEPPRPGRRRSISPAVIPPPRAATAARPDRTAMPAAGPDRTGCAACREGGALFPFSVAFQPVVDLQEGRIDAYEALVRGPAGEGAGSVLAQVTPESLYAFDQACRVKAIETAARLGIGRQLNINFLPNAVYDPRACIQTTLRTAARTGFPLNRLTFEIVESEVIADTRHLLNIIAEYHRHGFLIALDDFGTGYSGLARLVELKPDIVKIDRVLAQDCDTDRRRLAVIAGLVRMAGDLGVKVVIEGVERAEEVAALRSVGARFMQGFYFAKPAFEAVATDSDVRWPDAGVAARA